ncbi:MAG: HEPN domain-containing protein [Candidatus Bathyarchaeia archaeon]
MAREYIDRASRTLSEAKEALKAGDNALAIRRAQETVELSLKAALRFMAIEYPREHDLAGILQEVANLRRLPSWFEAEIPFMASVSRDLARKRGLAFYGDEAALRPPSSIFTEEDANRALRDAERVRENCRRLLEGSP